MRFSFKLHGRTLGLASLCAMTLWGCAQAPAPKFDERYRLFFASTLPVTANPGDAPEAIAQGFMPSVAVTRAIEEFEKQGFKLEEINPVEWGEGATLFVFRRRADVTNQPLRAPIHFVGIFRVENDSPDSTYYICSQQLDHYQVHVKSKDGIVTHRADWEGRELVWNDEAGKHNLRLTPDAMELYHITTNPNGFGVESNESIVKAARVVPIQVAETDDVRDARRFAIRLKPATPRYYDPYPW